ncbi:F-box protein SKIP1 [Primulina huaijiensis]|uniref:F-box protein SKIP1 n=1 Tax=Primulina huaijiensis TaxID=1492673 RepID=UPI003CC776DF
MEDGRLVGDWAELTEECFFNILSRLSLEDRWRGVMRVCKPWHLACKDPCLNSVLDLHAHFDSATDLPRFWTPEFERRIDNMLRSVVSWGGASLTEIRLSHCSTRSLSLVAERCPNLEVLSISSSAHVSDEIMAEIASGCPKIKELDVSYCHEISHKSLATIGSHCSNIKILRRNSMNWLDPSQHKGIVPKEYLNACPQDGDSEAAAISKYMPHLLHLELRFSKLTARGLALITKWCGNLEYIDLSGCANVTIRDVVNLTSSLKNLKHIKKPSFYIPRATVHAERYGHWNLYDERFQTDVFRI